MTLVSLGAARTRSDPKLRPTTRQIVSILGAKLWTFIKNAGGFSQIEEKCVLYIFHCPDDNLLCIIGS